MKIKVLFHIRWNLLWGAKPGSDKEELTPQRKTRKWNDHRIVLYERFCQPALAAQTYGDFECWLRCDSELKHLTDEDPEGVPLKDRLADKRFSVVYMNEIDDKIRDKAKGWKEEGYDTIFVCRIDSDDCIHKTALAEMIKALDDIGDKEYIQLDGGLVYDLPSQRMFAWNHPSPPFIGKAHSILQIIKDGMPPGFHHMRVSERCKTIAGRPFYMVVCHGGNVCNSIEARWVGRELENKEKKEALFKFGIKESKMVRWQVIARVVESLQAKVYLEIGIAKGANFVRQPTPPLRLKIGVSPDVARALVDFSDSRNHMYATLSDDFFKNQQAFLDNNNVDVAFIDGNHTWGQVERDVVNTLKYLAKDGVIILHDGNPLDCKMAMPAASHVAFKKAHPGTSAWTGDVWKAVVSLQSLPEFDHLDVFTLPIVTGLTFVIKGRRNTILPFDREHIKKLTYDDLDKNRERWLNIKSLDYFKERFPVRVEGDE